MAFREERIAENEAVVREINEMIQSAHESAPDISFMHIVCECGYEECHSIIALTEEEYERIRKDPRQFCVIEDHVIQDIETIVEDNDRFAIGQAAGGACGDSHSNRSSGLGATLHLREDPEHDRPRRLVLL